MLLVKLARWIAALDLLPHDVSCDLHAWAQARHDRIAEHYIVHKLKTEWLFSGVRQDERGFFSDIGFVRSPAKMNRAQALRYYHREFPKGVIKHIDDANKIITYSVSA